MVSRVRSRLGIDVWTIVRRAIQATMSVWACSFLLMASGCASSSEKIDWDAFLKDLSIESSLASDAVGPDLPAEGLPPPPTAEEQGKMAGEITIQPDCVLQVSVKEDSGLDGSYNVNEISAIQLGYVGPVFLSNMTEKQASDKIQEVLESRYFNRATVTVRILRASYDTVAVSGAVSKSGIIKIGSGDKISLNDALLRSGKVSAAVKGARIRIVRSGMRSAVSSAEDGEVYSLVDDNENPFVPDVYLWNNDIAYVYSSAGRVDQPTDIVSDKTVLVLGEVTRQGFYNFKGGANCTLMNLILQMNGFPAYADSKHIKIIRRDSTGGETEMEVNAKDILEEGDPELDVELEDGDRIIVPARKMSLF